MAIKERKGDFYLYFRPFKKKQVGLRVDVTHIQHLFEAKLGYFWFGITN